MKIAIISSNDQCGVRECSLVLLRGLQELGHDARYIGVTPHHNRDLMRAVRTEVVDDDELVIIEYEPGIFWLVGLVRALLWLRFVARKRVTLSVHEIAPLKYAEYRQVRWHLSRKVEPNLLTEIIKLTLGGFDVLLRFYVMRIGLLLLGALPQRVLVHSPEGVKNIRIALADEGKLHSIPLAIETVDADRDALRAELGLPPDLFAFISPGFFFRRKRFIQVAEALPDHAELWIVGTSSHFESDYADELYAYLATSPKRERIRLIEDYARMRDYLAAADAVVIYYSESFQSAVAAEAIGAGKPCIFSDLPAFDHLKEAGMIARNDVELARAMLAIQETETYQALVANARRLRTKYAPSAIASAYLEASSDTWQKPK